MSRTLRVVTWNGRDVPDELRDLPAARYALELFDEEAPAPSPDQEAGIEAALESHRRGRVIDAKRARQRRSRTLTITCTEELPLCS